MSQELVIALLAAGAALGGSLLGSFLTRTTEHKQWHRNEKNQAYIEYLIKLDELEKDLDTNVQAVGSDRLLAITAARSAIRLFGSATVRRLARDVDNEATGLWFMADLADVDSGTSEDRTDRRRAYSEFVTRYKASMVHLISAMREDLKVADPEDERIDAENAQLFLEDGAKRPLG
ncbi:hypothetical protein E8P82_04605 [Arthrobacter echini]|uniref:Uncharacterized protein n=1 Tax=Arthrobacter echini TaxID=1529066 RepID=A0A4S5E7C0_9MICC|nr:hypothetical protein [Arthrobacter echini]THJ67392.1 hypothetical protein E8P82_04605 [Arthrobacter echini]